MILPHIQKIYPPTFYHQGWFQSRQTMVCIPGNKIKYKLNYTYQILKCFSMQKSSCYIYTHWEPQTLFAFFLKELLRDVNAKPKFKQIQYSTYFSRKESTLLIELKKLAELKENIFPAACWLLWQTLSLITRWTIVLQPRT